jgi:hypothetical protein
VTGGHPLPSSGRCPVCGVDEGRLSVDDALDTIRTLGRRYREVVTGVPPEAVFREPAPSEWSMADYVAHVREVLQVLAADLDTVLDHHRAQVPDPDTVTSDRPHAGDLLADLDALDGAARSIAERGSRTSALAWDRPFELDGAERPARWIVQHAAHEGAHHLRDLERVRQVVAPSDDT